MWVKDGHGLDAFDTSQGFLLYPRRLADLMQREDLSGLRQTPAYAWRLDSMVFRRRAALGAVERA